ncbi:ABC transporter ATP-binding protein [Candidatus Formimonas warabiya]|uniref:ABC transporter ATP-binding protein n=1 Tax=Formimonas warabiya TaxID=1761012 RepID=A0A3G1KQM4_FORW1|nr:ABC transporter ATP-binding protein [Candidatus Formimonas warabiya]
MRGGGIRVLQVDSIYAKYGRVQALNGVSLQLKEKSIVALLGANGAGKSTILKTITGLLKPYQGTVSFLGERIDRLAAERIVTKGIVMVPEGRQIFPESTVMENLLLGSYTRKDRAQVKQDMEYVFSLYPILAEKTRNLAGTLSGGQQQMLAIGRGLMAKPRLLLLDEPSMGLAPIVVQEIFRIIKEINHNGTTILLVEQNARMALAISDYAYVLETGRVSCEGTPDILQKNEEVLKSYLGG